MACQIASYVNKKSCFYLFYNVLRGSNYLRSVDIELKRPQGGKSGISAIYHLAYKLNQLTVYLPTYLPRNPSNYYTSLAANIGVLSMFAFIWDIVFINGPNPTSICSFSFFPHDKNITNLTINYKNIDGSLGTQTRGGRMVGKDESTELWRHAHLRHHFRCLLTILAFVFSFAVVRNLWMQKIRFAALYQTIFICFALFCVSYLFLIRGNLDRI